MLVVQADRHGEGELVVALRVAKMVRQLRSIATLHSLMALSIWSRCVMLFAPWGRCGLSGVAEMSGTTTSKVTIPKVVEPCMMTVPAMQPTSPMPGLPTRSDDLEDEDGY
jgi:hypothetical protein